MAPLMRRPVLLGVIALAVMLSACGHADSADLPKRRTQVRGLTAQLVPALADKLGGSTGDASGRYDESGGDLSAITFSYSAGATIHVSDVQPDVPAIEKALKDLGYDVTTSSTPDGQATTTSRKDDLDILVSVGGPTGDHDVAVSVASPYVKVPKKEVKDYQAKVAKEPLTLK